MKVLELFKKQWKFKGIKSRLLDAPCSNKMSSNVYFKVVST